MMPLLSTKKRPSPAEVAVHYRKPYEEGSLLHYLRFDTLDIHLVAERAMRDLLFDGAGDKSVKDRVSAYALYLLQLYVLYSTLEDELSNNSTHPAVKLVYFPEELSRANSIADDLDYFLGHQWRAKLETHIVPATIRYKERLREISATQPELLIAHAYARNLGDMANGLPIKGLLREYCKLIGQRGLSFFRFENIVNLSKFRHRYTERMNETVKTESGIEKQVEEGNRSFQFIADMCLQIEALGDAPCFNASSYLVLRYNAIFHQPIVNVLLSCVKRLKHSVKVLVTYLFNSIQNLENIQI